MSLAVAIADALVVDNAHTDGNGQGWLTVRIEPNDYAGFKRLPQAVAFEGRTYGFSGWNSDTGAVWYRTGVPVARKLPGRIR